MSDVIYTISIDGQVAYVGKSNNFERREEEHETRVQGKIRMMRESYPDATISMQCVHRNAQDGAQLNALEGFYIRKFDTLARTGAGEGENKFRWNKKMSDRSAHGTRISDADVERFLHIHVCDGPSIEPCVGNAEWPPQRIQTMIKEVEIARALEEMMLSENFMEEESVAREATILQL